MTKKEMTIDQIPAVLWGPKTSHLMLAVHGVQSSKNDPIIAMLAESVVPKGYQVLSFDLAEHGERVNRSERLTLQNGLNDLLTVLTYAKEHYSTISIMGNSLGAYFTLLAGNTVQIHQAFFLSPVVDMKRLIDDMMLNAGIDREQLEKEQIITMPWGQTFYWEDYQFVRDKVIENWDIPTAILYGNNDAMIPYQEVLSFSDKVRATLCISETSAHYFHTDHDLDQCRKWVHNNLFEIKC